MKATLSAILFLNSFTLNQRREYEIHITLAAEIITLPSIRGRDFSAENEYLRRIESIGQKAVETGLDQKAITPDYPISHKDARSGNRGAPIR